MATVAFGMGLDIRRIIHWGPPSDVEAYLQELEELEGMEVVFVHIFDAVIRISLIKRYTV